MIGNGQYKVIYLYIIQGVIGEKYKMKTNSTISQPLWQTILKRKNSSN